MSAVIDEVTGVPAHYGSPFAEQRQLRAGHAYTDLGHLDVLTVSGADRLTWLTNLSTRDFSKLNAGEASEMLILDPNGHIQEAASVQLTEDEVWLITDAGRGESLAAFLNSMRFMLRVEVTERTDVTVFGTGMPASALPADVAEKALLVWEDPWPRTAVGGADYGISDARHPAADSHRTLVVVPASDGDEVRSAFGQAGLSPAGLLAWEANRVVDRRPRMGAEGIVERVLPHELDWLRTAIHLNKGCYRGQETVAKIVNLGRPPRRLTYLYLEGPQTDLPEPGAEVVSERGRKVGVLTSVVRDVDEGPVALALLKRSTPVDELLSVGAYTASQEVIVSPEGKSSVSPASRPGAEFRGRK